MKNKVICITYMEKPCFNTNNQEAIYLKYIYIYIYTYDFS